MQQKVIWFVLFLIICGLTFYIVVIRPTEIDENTTIKKDHEELIMEVNETNVIHEDFEKMWIGRGKHIETIQETAEDFRKTYDAKMKDIEKEFDVVDNNITKAEERLNKLIEDVEEEIEDLEKKHKTFKKKTDRKIKDLQYKQIARIENKLESLYEMENKIDILMNLKSLQKEIKRYRDRSN